METHQEEDFTAAEAAYHEQMHRLYRLARRKYADTPTSEAGPQILSDLRRYTAWLKLSVPLRGKPIERKAA